MTETCAHCGRQTQDYNGGWARDGEGRALCHPNQPGRPDRFHLVTNSTYGHTVAPCLKCGIPIRTTDGDTLGYVRLHVSDEMEPGTLYMVSSYVEQGEVKYSAVKMTGIGEGT